MSGGAGNLVIQELRKQDPRRDKSGALPQEEYARQAYERIHERFPELFPNPDDEVIDYRDKPQPVPEPPPPADPTQTQAQQAVTRFLPYKGFHPGWTPDCRCADCAGRATAVTP